MKVAFTGKATVETVVPDDTKGSPQSGLVLVGAHRLRSPKVSGLAQRAANLETHRVFLAARQYQRDGRTVLDQDLARKSNPIQHVYEV